MTPHQIYQLVAPELMRVEEELRGYTRSDIQPIVQIGEYLLSGGGKRIRPAILLLTAKMLGEVTPTIIRLAAVVEFIHNATLVHDDIIDEAGTRRGRPTANSVWGNSMTVLAGDWLYMQSFAVALGERSFDVLQTLIDITQKMVEGELLQLTLLGRTDVTEEQLLDIVDRKTACLFAGCTKLPALAISANHGCAERLARVGRHLGMAFQLTDDLLDLASSTNALGKPVVHDLKEGKVTLPVLFALRNSRPEDWLKVKKVLEERDFRSVHRSEIVELVKRADGLARTRAIASEHVRSAVQILEDFPASVYRDALVSVTEYILNRNA